MIQKLPGYDQAQELVKIYRKVGFNNQEIAEQLTKIEELVFSEIVVEIEEGMGEEEKKKFDKFLVKESPTPEKISQYLKLDKKELGQKIERKIQAFIDQITEDLTKTELSLEELKAALLDVQKPKQAKPEEVTQKQEKNRQSFLGKIFSQLRGSG